MKDGSTATIDRQEFLDSLKERVNDALERNEDRAICLFVDNLIDTVQNGSAFPSPPDVGEWRSLAEILLAQARLCKGNLKQFRNMLKTLQIKEKDFARLYKRYQAIREQISADTDSVHTQQKTAPNAPARPDYAMPALNPRFLPAPGASNGVGLWLARYGEFCRASSGRGYTGHFEVTGAWILSTVAAGRVCFYDGSLQWTPLNVAVVAPSSVWGKTATAQAANRVLRQAGLHWLLSSNSSSPEKLLSNMAGKFLPSNYGTLSEDLQLLERLRLAHSGQRGWYYSEFGQFIREAANDKGRNAPFKAFVLRMDDCEPEYENDTFKRERETIERPCLSLLGTMVPGDIAPRQAQNGEEAWSNGFYGRFMFACPPPGIIKTRERLIAEDKTGKNVAVPSDLVQALVDWNERLTMRECELEPALDRNGKPTDSYTVYKGVFPECVYDIAPGAAQMIMDYGIELAQVVQAPELARLESSYIRLRDKALRIAAVVASIEDTQDTRMIEARHMAYGIEFAERRRQDLHNLMAYAAYNPAENSLLALEKEILDTVGKIQERGKGVTMREMYHSSRTIAQAHEEQRLERSLAGLCNAGALMKKVNGRRQEYTLCEEA